MIKYIVLSLILTFTIPGGPVMATEEPVFKLVLQAGEFEVREYPALIAAEVSVGGDRSEAVNAGFRLLAGYIFGGNTRSQSIAMTAPVIQAPPAGESIAMTAPVTQSGNADAWVIRFIMPSSYTLDTLPTPNDPRVQLKALAPSRVAVVRFSGLAHEADIEQKTTELNAFIAANNLRAAGPPSLARYNPPWTLWFLRRNEVMIPLQDATTH
jgi:hypothetical protein